MKSGFTLVELLVVLAVIAVLAGMLLPALSKARERSRRAVCAGNLRQISLALVMYAQDNAELLPMGGPPSEWTNGNPKGPLVACLSSYGPGRKTFYCPSWAASSRFDPAVAETDANWQAGNIGYYYWSYATAHANVPSFSPKARTLTLKRRNPSETWVMSDWFKAGCLFPHTGTMGSLLLVSFLDGHTQVVYGRPIDAFR